MPLFSIAVSLVIACLILNVGYAFINVELFGMTFRPDNFDSLLIFANQGLMKLLPEISIIVHFAFYLVVLTLSNFIFESIGHVHETFTIRGQVNGTISCKGDNCSRELGSGTAA